MKKFTKKDLFFCLVTGLTAGVISWQIFLFLKAPFIFGLPSYLLIFILPIAWMIGVNAGYFLSRWSEPFGQFGKFAVVGFTNFVVDTGVLNLFIAASGQNAGISFSIFKAISFFTATLHSYFWNRLWVFEIAPEGQEGKTFGKFVVVAGVAIIVNVTSASFVVALGPSLGFSGDQWANLAAVAGSAIALIFSFFGYKIAVFKK